MTKAENQPYHVVIPARYNSGRLPGKPLLAMGGKPMIQWVVEAARASAASSVTVATDDRRIESAVKEFGGEAVMTRDNHVSGSDRIAEACALLGLCDDAVVVNVQGDEPLIPSILIDQVAALLVEKNITKMATLCTPITSHAEFVDPAVVKVVRSENDIALYFSRAPIPWERSDQDSSLAAGSGAHGQRHLGIYAYRSGYIREFAARAPCSIEQMERLEQLRVLWHGDSIACAIAAEVPEAGVDNEADYQRVCSILQ